MSLDLADLELIAQETRQCFLAEDAPGYLANLQKGVERIQQGNPDYTAMMHAAHSLKGGAGIAQFVGLSKLGHKLEDLLEILQEQKFGDRDLLVQVLSHSVHAVADVLAQAQAMPQSSLEDISVDRSLLETLDLLLENVKNSSSSVNLSSSPGKLGGEKKISPMVRSSLTRDLEECLSNAEQMLNQAQASPQQRQQALSTLLEESSLLGEALDLSWLCQIVEPLAISLAQSTSDMDWQSIGTEIVAEIRRQRDDYLSPVDDSNSVVSVRNPVTETIQSPLNSYEDTITTFPIAEFPSATTKSPPSQLTSQVSSQATATLTHFRIPSSRMERMVNTVGELIVRHERLIVQQKQLGQNSRNLRQLVQRLAPIQDEVQALYNQLTIAASANLSPSEKAADKAAGDIEFDSLEMDRYTTGHISLQNFQETLLRIREARADIDLSHRDLAEEIELLRQDLDRLYYDLTQSRLVPFKNLAQRFTPQLSRLCQQYGKSVQLVINGEDVLIDQVILEQLQTPLNHLLVNAFDHGIEVVSDRISVGKPEIATITLSASISGNQVEIILADDGGGIDLVKVHQRAIDRQLCDPHIPIQQWRREEILNFIFQPGFSTAPEVSALSGRGMGLDIVRSQINKLRGTVRVNTKPGDGTTFTVNLPLGLSLISLLVCRLGDRFLALPAMSVLDILLTSELEQLSEGTDTLPSQIKWRQQAIPVLLLERLFYSSAIKTPPRVCLILSGQSSPIAVKIDAIVEEKQLILKPFDLTVPVPPYLAGCTILGTGKVVPVLLPHEFGLLLQHPKLPISPFSLLPQTQSKTATVLIAEDSITTRNLLERVLKQVGYKVLSCRDGQEAIDALQSATAENEQIKLVISDIEMPRINGFTLLQTIRTDEQFYALPVIMLTSRTGDRHRQKAISLGATAYLTKPFMPNDIIAAIAPFIASN
jgi:chemotaxis protein histidine kinase CheA/ActR/RegA family two-component response regulator